MALPLRDKPVKGALSPHSTLCRFGAYVLHDNVSALDTSSCCLTVLAVLFTQHEPFPSTLFLLGSCKEFQLAADELAVAIVKLTGSNQALWNREDAKMSNNLRGWQQTF